MSSHEVTRGQKTLSAYVLGFVLSLILTVLAFGCVQLKVLSDAGLYIALTVLALTQLFVQSVCFLRLNTSAEGRWNLLPFLFVILIVAFLVGGTLWIMYNLSYFMNH
jgi:cytochrome o ubiquinol oxidase subunit IV